jgi:hypothetical protein
MKRIVRFAVVFIAACSLGAGPQREQPTPEMKADVARLVAHANRLKRLWPWQPPVPEVDRVARHGKTVAPLLVALIGDDPDLPEPDRPEWRVQQQAALALCRIYGVRDECGHVYCNRASREQNKRVKTFWVSKIGE